MGFLDDITETAFKEGVNGETIYFPNGVLSKGRVIKDPVLKQKIFKFHKRLIKYLVPLAILYGMIMGLGGVAAIDAILPLIVIAAFVLIRQRILIKGLPQYDAKLTVKEVSISTSKALHPGVLIFMMLNGVVCIVISVLLPFLFDTTIKEIKLLVVIIFTLGVAGLAVSFYLYKLKSSGKSLKEGQRGGAP